jgi:NADH-quinone oxidoreductase subunit J
MAMQSMFFVAAMVAIAATARVITAMHPVHALLYLIVSLLAVALIFFTLGAPFAAALEVIIYAGAIMVLFVFVMMMLNLGEADAARERSWISPGMWVGPAVLAAVLLIELIYLVVQGAGAPVVRQAVGAKTVGTMLFGPYVLGVELASMLLLAGLVGACHVGRRNADETD